MRFKYNGMNSYDQPVKGELEAESKLDAITMLQNQKIVVSEINQVKTLADFEFDFFNNVSTKEVVLLSRQLATLFNANVSTIRIFAMLAQETESLELSNVLKDVAAELESGSTLSKSLGRHPKVFSPFYVNMVASGEETGKLNQVFMYLADYLERNYELTSKAKNALVYPAFVISTFVGVMVLMLAYIIPKIGIILRESGQELPFYTRVVLGASDLMVAWGFLFLAIVVLGVSALIFYVRSDNGKAQLSEVGLRTPYLGNLYKKLYLSRLADNMYTMLSSGISMVRSLETTKSVIGNVTYETLLQESIVSVRGGKQLSESLSNYPEFVPPIMSQMILVGEESGNVGEILKTLSDFYKREVSNAVDTLVGLIEPVMIVLLGLGVGTLLASVLIPIYNVSTGI